MSSEDTGPTFSGEGSHSGLLGYTGHNGRKRAALCLAGRCIHARYVQADAAEKRPQAAERLSLTGSHCPESSGKER